MLGYGILPWRGTFILFTKLKVTWKIFFRASSKVCTSANDKFSILLNSLVSFFLSGVAQCLSAGQHVCIALLFYRQIVCTHMALYIMHFHVLMQTCLLLSIEMVGYCCICHFKSFLLHSYADTILQ